MKEALTDFHVPMSTRLGIQRVVNQTCRKIDGVHTLWTKASTTSFDARLYSLSVHLNVPSKVNRHEPDKGKYGHTLVSQVRFVHSNNINRVVLPSISACGTRSEIESVGSYDHNMRCLVHSPTTLLARQPTVFVLLLTSWCCRCFLSHWFGVVIGGSEFFAIPGWRGISSEPTTTSPFARATVVLLVGWWVSIVKRVSRHYNSEV